MTTRNPAALALDKPRSTPKRRHRVVLEFDSASDGRSFKAKFKEKWDRYDTAFPGTLVFMSHETVKVT